LIVRGNSSKKKDKEIEKLREKLNAAANISFVRSLKETRKLFKEFDVKFFFNGRNNLKPYYINENVRYEREKTKTVRYNQPQMAL